ncbi:hypothetical protein [Methanomethylophilus alvi]|uniref:hypothetical protein n=1 Tax=Methanomethylophilus alvi TaxID=1291540 RepID=UPI0037DBF45E
MPNPYIIVISCVTTETVMVSSPSIFYKADEVHLFRYIRDLGTASAKLYEDHYREACNQILRSLPSCRIVDGRRVPVEGPIVGHIVDGKYVPIDDKARVSESPVDIKAGRTSGSCSIAPPTSWTGCAAYTTGTTP